jgi:hypothetical protein
MTKTICYSCVLALILSLMGCGGSPSSTNTRRSFPATGLGGASWKGDPDLKAAKPPYLNTVANYGTWGDGSVFVVWSDFKTESGRSMTKDTKVVYEGVHTTDQRNLEFRCSTTDGKTGTVTIDGKTYDLEKANVFLVTMIDGKLDITTLKHDLSKISNSDGLTALTEKDPKFGEVFAKIKPKQ